MVSLMNGISGLGAGIEAFSGAAARESLMNNIAPRPSAQVAVTPPGGLPQDVQAAIASAGGTPPSPAATPGAHPDLSRLPKDQALAAIIQRESGGQNIPTAILGPDGKPASTASGYYQMIDGTWQEAAALAGLKNPPPRALLASRAEQDAAASALWDKYGYKPWAPSAPARQAAITPVPLPGGMT